MSIDFHDQQNRMTYTTRAADTSWHSCIQENIDVSAKRAADIGCGGGIYTKALVSLGAAHVTGVDFSAEMLKGAAENCKGLDNVTFVQGDAYDTGLAASEFDLILERALIHHLTELDRCFKEANRLLKNNGTFVIQDRTPEDCTHPGNVNHIRGYFFEKYPRLIEKEIARRHDSAKVRRSLKSNGFTMVKEVKLWETRNVYPDFERLRQDLSQRTGRSILHALTNNELDELVAFIESKLENSPTPIVEKDLWTLWFAKK